MYDQQCKAESVHKEEAFLSNFKVPNGINHPVRILVCPSPAVFLHTETDTHIFSSNKVQYHKANAGGLFCSHRGKARDESLE